MATSAAFCASIAGAQSFPFAPAVTRACTPNHLPTRVLHTDVDLNGSLDLLVPGRDSNKLINWCSLDSAGVPGAMLSFAAPGQTDAAAVGDFDGDGTPDLAFAVRSFAGKLAVYLRGEAGLGEPVLTDLDREPRSLVAGDWDGNGATDLASLQYGNQAAVILLNAGAGHFQVSQRLPVEPWSGGSAGPQELLVGDMNGDGRDDLVGTTLGTRRVDVFIGNGDGTFASPVAWMAPDLPNGSRPGVTTAALGDMDLDGDLDVVVSLIAASGPQMLMVMSNDGTAHFGVPQLFPFTSESDLAWSTALGDLDADGDLDVVTGTALGGGLYAWENLTPPRGTVALGESTRFANGSFVRDIVMGHMDNDCDMDVAYAEIGANTVRVYRQLRDCSANVIGARGGKVGGGGKAGSSSATTESPEEIKAHAEGQAMAAALRAQVSDAAELAVLLSTFGVPPDRAQEFQSFTESSSCGPGGPGGRCDEPHMTPGCFTTPCCEAVCEIAPDCCTVAWDQLCVDIADSECSGLVCPQYGSCSEIHADPGCEDTDCCSRITRIDGYCEELWDRICVERAAELCGTVPCTVTVPSSAIDELELCYEHLNDGPNYLDAVAILPNCNDIYTGTITSSSPRDTDWYLLPGTGRRHIDFSVNAEFPAEIHLVAGVFSGPLQAVKTVYGGHCAQAMMSADIDGPGDWYVVVTLGTPAGAIRQGQPCTEEDPRDPWDEQNPPPTPGFDGVRYVAQLQCSASGNPADFNHDGIVNGADLGTLLGQWGLTGFPQADLNGDGVVDGADLGTLLGAWGPVR